MNIKEITIGRSRGCDIFLDEQCIYASKHHGAIYYDGNQLMFRDYSSNGTLINNIMVKHRAVPIKRGDVIALAGRYQLSWNQINSFFGYNPTSQVMSNSQAEYVSQPKPLSREESYGQSATEKHSSMQQPAQSTDDTPDLSGWSWGAFVFSGIWGLFNGCWWLFLIDIIIFIMCFIPVVGIIAIIVFFIWTIVRGVQGREWAWNNKEWSSVEDFKSTQKTWNTVGLVFFLIGIFGAVITFVFAGSFLLAMFSAI